MNPEQLEAVVLESSYKLDEILRRLNLPQKKPGLTITAFAEASGLSYSTVCRMLNRHELRRVNGRIPYELLAKFLS